MFSAPARVVIRVLWPDESPNTTRSSLPSAIALALVSISSDRRDLSTTLANLLLKKELIFWPCTTPSPGVVFSFQSGILAGLIADPRWKPLMPILTSIKLGENHYR